MTVTWGTVIVALGAPLERILCVTLPQTASTLPAVSLLPSVPSSGQMVSCCVGITKEPSP